MILTEWADNILFLYLGDNEISTEKKDKARQFAEKVWTDLLSAFPLWSPSRVEAIPTREGVLQDNEGADITKIVFSYLEDVKAKTKTNLPIFLGSNENCEIYQTLQKDFIKNANGLYIFVTTRDIEEFNADKNLKLFCITKNLKFDENLLPENLPLSFMQCAEELYLYYLSYVFPTLSEKFRELRYSKYYNLLQQTTAVYSIKRQQATMPFIHNGIVQYER